MTGAGQPGEGDAPGETDIRGDKGGVNGIQSVSAASLRKADESKDKWFYSVALNTKSLLCWH